MDINTYLHLHQQQPADEGGLWGQARGRCLQGEAAWVNKREAVTLSCTCASMGLRGVAGRARGTCACSNGTQLVKGRAATAVGQGLSRTEDVNEVSGNCMEGGRGLGEQGLPAALAPPAGLTHILARRQDISSFPMFEPGPPIRCPLWPSPTVHRRHAGQGPDPAAATVSRGQAFHICGRRSEAQWSCVASGLGGYTVLCR